MNIPKPKVGQTYKRVGAKKQYYEWVQDTITITYVGVDYFTFKEDPDSTSWTFDLLTDKYELVGEA